MFFITSPKKLPHPTVPQPLAAPAAVYFLSVSLPVLVPSQRWNPAT